MAGDGITIAELMVRLGGDASGSLSALSANDAAIERSTALAQASLQELGAAAGTMADAMAGSASVVAEAMAVAAQAMRDNAAAGQALYESNLQVASSSEAVVAASQANSEALAANTGAIEANTQANVQLASSIEALIAGQSAEIAAVSENSAALQANTAAVAENAGAQDAGAAASGRFAGGMMGGRMEMMLAIGAATLLTKEVVGLGLGFEAAMNKSEAFAGVSHSDMAAITQDTLSISKASGEGAKQVADGLYLVESAGFRGADAMTILRETTLLATAAQTDSKTVTDAVTSALNAYHLSASNVTQVADVLSATTVAGKMQFADLATSIGRVLPVSAEAGIGLDQIGASIATMTEKGLSADEAVTSVRATILALEAPTKQTQTALAAMGLSVEDVTASIRDKGYLATLDDLVARTGGSMEALRQLIPNVRGLAGALADTGTPGNQDYARSLDAISNSSGAAQHAIDSYQATAGAALERLKANIEDDLIQATQGLDQELGKLADGTVALMNNDTAEWFAHMGASALAAESPIIAMTKAGSDVATVLGGMSGGIEHLGSDIDAFLPGPAKQFLDWLGNAAVEAGKVGLEIALWMNPAYQAMQGLDALANQFGPGAPPPSSDPNAIANSLGLSGMAPTRGATGDALGLTGPTQQSTQATQDATKAAQDNATAMAQEHAAAQILSGELVTMAGATDLVDAATKSAAGGGRDAAQAHTDLAAAIALGSQSFNDRQAAEEAASQADIEATGSVTAHTLAQNDLTEAVAKYGPAAAQAKLDTADMASALKDIKSNGGDATQELDFVAQHLGAVGDQAKIVKGALEDVLGKPTKEESGLKVQIDQAQQGIDSWNATLQNSSPIDQRIAQLAQQQEQEQRSGASADQLAKTTAELNNQLAQVPDSEGAAVVAGQLHADALDRTVKSLQDQLKLLQDQRSYMDDVTKSQDTTATSMSSLATVWGESTTSMGRANDTLGTNVDTLTGKFEALHTAAQSAFDFVKAGLAGAGGQGDISKGVGTASSFITSHVPSGASGGAGAATGGIPGDINAWAAANAAKFGVDPQQLATALLSLSSYESNLSDVGEASGGGGQGPFQFTGDTANAATAAGFDIHSASGSLNAFAASGDMATGVAAMQAWLATHPGDMSGAAHAMELAMERPNAQVDASRVASGDWAASFATGSSLAGGAGTAPIQPSAPILGTPSGPGNIGPGGTTPGGFALGPNQYYTPPTVNADGTTDYSSEGIHIIVGAPKGGGATGQQTPPGITVPGAAGGLGTAGQLPAPALNPATDLSKTNEDAASVQAKLDSLDATFEKLQAESDALIASPPSAALAGEAQKYQDMFKGLPDLMGAVDTAANQYLSDLASGSATAAQLTIDQQNLKAAIDGLTPSLTAAGREYTTLTKEQGDYDKSTQALTGLGNQRGNLQVGTTKDDHSAVTQRQLDDDARVRDADQTTAEHLVDVATAAWQKVNDEAGTVTQSQLDRDTAQAESATKSANTAYTVWTQADSRYTTDHAAFLAQRQALDKQDAAFRTQIEDQGVQKTIAGIQHMTLTHADYTNTTKMNETKAANAQIDGIIATETVHDNALAAQQQQDQTFYDQDMAAYQNEAAQKADIQQALKAATDPIIIAQLQAALDAINKEMDASKLGADAAVADSERLAKQRQEDAGKAVEAANAVKKATEDSLGAVPTSASGGGGGGGGAGSGKTGPHDAPYVPLTTLISSGAQGTPGINYDAHGNPINAPPGTKPLPINPVTGLPGVGPAAEKAAADQAAQGGGGGEPASMDQNYAKQMLDLTMQGLEEDRKQRESIGLHFAELQKTLKDQRQQVAQFIIDGHELRGYIENSLGQWLNAQVGAAGG